MTMQLTKRPVRGGLVDGPVYERIFKSLKGVAITEPDPLAAFQGHGRLSRRRAGLLLERADDGRHGLGDPAVGAVHRRRSRLKLCPSD